MIPMRKFAHYFEFEVSAYGSRVLSLLPFQGIKVGGDAPSTTPTSPSLLSCSSTAADSKVTVLDGGFFAWKIGDQRFERAYMSAKEFQYPIFPWTEQGSGTDHVACSKAALLTGHYNPNIN